MEKITNIQNYIVELYNLTTKKGDFNSEANKMFNSVKNWESAFEPFSEEQIKGAIDYFHKYKNNKTAPKINQLLNLLKVERTEEPVESTIKKPTCPILEWQEDFDLVLRQACIKGVVYNPYWNKQPEIEEAHKDFIKTPFVSHKEKIKWKDSLITVREQFSEGYQKLLKYDNEVLLYTYAYKRGILEL